MIKYYRWWHMHVYSLRLPPNNTSKVCISFVSNGCDLTVEKLNKIIATRSGWNTVRSNFLQLNQDKTEVLVIGPEAQREKSLPKLQELSFTPSSQVKNLGDIFDSELNFIPHIKDITKVIFYHLKNIARVRPILSDAFITSRIDNCNSLPSGLLKHSVKGLQLLQNSAAQRAGPNYTVLKSLHWLPVSFKIDFKFLSMVFKLLLPYGPSWTLLLWQSSPPNS